MGPRLVLVNDVDALSAREALRILAASRFAVEARVFRCDLHLLATGEETESVQIQVKVNQHLLTDVIKALQRGGFTTFDVLDVLSSTEKLSTERRPKENGCCGKRFRSSRNRLSTLEIHNGIVGSSHLTCDHVVLVMLASAFAAIGLLTDSPVNILAAFFVSPLMSMIMAVTWGFVIRDARLVMRGIRNAIIGAALAIGVGACCGGLLALGGCGECLLLYAHKGKGIYQVFYISGHEVLSRGPPALATVGTTVLVAAFSGMTIAMGTAMGISSALSGVTLAASLLPPLVNCGIMLVLAVVFSDLEVHSDRGPVTPFEIAVVSFMMYFVTVLMVPFFAFLTLKAKRIGGRRTYFESIETPGLVSIATTAPGMTELSADGTPPPALAPPGGLGDVGDMRAPLVGTGTRADASDGHRRGAGTEAAGAAAGAGPAPIADEAFTFGAAGGGGSPS